MGHLLRLLAFGFCVLLAPLTSWSFPIFRPELRFTERDADGLDVTDPAAAVPIAPSLDPWYRAPTGWEATSPGTVLRIRQAPYLQYTVGNALKVYHILYRTTDSKYNPSWAVTTLFIPLWQYRCSTTTAALCAHALLSYQIPYDSANVDASPSFALHGGEPFGEISDALYRGWFVSVPDYEGPQASFTAGVMAGHATIDSIRAVLAIAGGFGLRLPVAQVALWGYSGGALASEWAAELAVQYAPRMPFVGMALGGLAPNLTSVADKINGQDTAGLFPSGLIGITSQHPEARLWLQSRLKTTGPHNATGFFTAAYVSGNQCAELYDGQNIYDYFVGGRADLSAPVMQDVFDNDGVMGYHGTPSMPIFMYKAINDELSRVSETDELVGRYCGDGANILYHRNTVGGHDEEIVNGRAAAIAFLTSVLDGNYALVYKAVGCTTLNVTVDVAPRMPKMAFAWNWGS